MSVKVLPSRCVSAPGPKRITLESCDKIKLQISCEYCLYVVLPNQHCQLQMFSFAFVRATNMPYRVNSIQQACHFIVAFTCRESRANAKLMFSSSFNGD